jgi:hypothetical protein
MDRGYAVASDLRVRLVGLADWLYGCSHCRTTFPITLRASAGGDGRPGTQPETYVACLDCGRHFAYDWTNMRITRRRLAWMAPPALLPALGATGRGSR